MPFLVVWPRRNANFSKKTCWVQFSFFRINSHEKLFVLIGFCAFRLGETRDLTNWSRHLEPIKGRWERAGNAGYSVFWGENAIFTFEHLCFIMRASDGSSDPKIGSPSLHSEPRRRGESGSWDPNMGPMSCSDPNMAPMSLHSEPMQRGPNTE